MHLRGQQRVFNQSVSQLGLERGGEVGRSVTWPPQRFGGCVRLMLLGGGGDSQLVIVVVLRPLALHPASSKSVLSCLLFS